LEFGTGARDQKTRMMELPGRERSMAISSAVWIQYTNGTEGRTDRQTPADSKDRAYAQRRAVIIFCHIQLMLLFTSSAVTETARCTCAIYTPSPMCHHVEFGRSRSNATGISRESQKTAVLGPVPWSGGCHAQFYRRWSNGTIVCMEIRQKIGSLAFRLSRSLEVIRTDTDWSAAYDLLITFHIVTAGLSCTVSKI